jgi:hypothetical protein
VRPVYHPEFKVSFDDALRHYQEISPALALRFKGEVKAGVKQVLSGLVSHAPGPHGFRCYRCKKFRHLIYYELSHDGWVKFLAVLYAGRAPDYLCESLSRYGETES